MKVKDLLPLIDANVPIFIGFNEETEELKRNNPLQVLAYSDFIIDSVLGAVDDGVSIWIKGEYQPLKG